MEKYLKYIFYLFLLHEINFVILGIYVCFQLQRIDAPIYSGDILYFIIGTEWLWVPAIFLAMTALVAVVKLIEKMQRKD